MSTQDAALGAVYAVSQDYVGGFGAALAVVVALRAAPSLVVRVRRFLRF